MELVWNWYGIRLVHQAPLAQAARQRHERNTLMWRFRCIHQDQGRVLRSNSAPEQCPSQVPAYFRM
jgi:hypothetical protein